jgi:hypothetical protein
MAVEGERFPQLYLAIDGRRYRLLASDASALGQSMADAARRTVNLGRDPALRTVVFESEVAECSE